MGAWVPNCFFYESRKTFNMLYFCFFCFSFFKKTNPVGVSGPLAFDSTGRRTNFTIYVVGGHRDNVVATWNAESPDVLTFMRSDNDSYDALVKNMQKGVLIVSSRF